MADPTDAVLAQFLKNLTDLLTPVAGQVAFGNVRLKVTQTTLEGGRAITNCALTYESPGGSTNQINIAYEHNSHRFRILSDESGEEEQFADPAPILARIDSLLRAIPGIRMTRLKWDLDRWITDGKTRPQILSTLSRMLQADSGLRGGGITQDELNEASRYLAQQLK